MNVEIYARPESSFIFSGPHPTKLSLLSFPVAIAEKKTNPATRRRPTPKYFYLSHQGSKIKCRGVVAFARDTFISASFLNRRDAFQRARASNSPLRFLFFFFFFFYLSPFSLCRRQRREQLALAAKRRMHRETRDDLAEFDKNSHEN